MRVLKYKKIISLNNWTTFNLCPEQIITEELYGTTHFETILKIIKASDWKYTLYEREEKVVEQSPI